MSRSEARGLVMYAPPSKRVCERVGYAPAKHVLRDDAHTKQTVTQPFAGGVPTGITASGANPRAWGLHWHTGREPEAGGVPRRRRSR